MCSGNSETIGQFLVILSKKENTETQMYWILFILIGPKSQRCHPTTPHIVNGHTLQSISWTAEHSTLIQYNIYICDSSGRNQSHVGRVCFPLRAEMHGKAHITDSCFIAFITSKYVNYHMAKYHTWNMYLNTPKRQYLEAGNHFNNSKWKLWTWISGIYIFGIEVIQMSITF